VLGGAPKPSRVPVAVVDLDGSAVTADIVKAMKADTAFDLRESSADEGTRLVREGKVRAAVVIPAGFGDAAP
jgi:ABC-2 type transport system permease protein